MYDNYSGNIREDISYSNSLSKKRLYSSIKKTMVYGFILVLWLVVSKLYLNFGDKLIMPAVSAMWVMGGITTFFIKEQKEETIKFTKFSILGYLLFLLLYRGVIGLIAPISSEQMGAALNISIPAASGLAAAGMLQNILIIVSIMTPIASLGYCAQKFKMYFGGSTKQDAFARIKDIRKK